MCLQTVLSIRQRCERPVTIPLHLRRCTVVYKSLRPFLKRPANPVLLLKWPHSRLFRNSLESVSSRRVLFCSCRRSPAGHKKRAGEALRLFSMPGLCCRDPVSAGRASGHPCKCAGPSGGHTSCSPRGPHARGHLPCWYAGTSRPRRGRTRATYHGYASLHR